MQGRGMPHLLKIREGALGRCSQRTRAFRQWRWHVDKVFVKTNGECLGFGIIRRIIRRLRYVWRGRGGGVRCLCLTSQKAGQIRGFAISEESAEET